jgi:hypothetical protein
VVSAVLRLPLGVTRILIADMAAEGLDRIHQSDDSEGRPDLQLAQTGAGWTPLALAPPVP